MWKVSPFPPTALPFQVKKKILPFSYQNCEAFAEAPAFIDIASQTRTGLGWVRVKTLKTVLLGDVTHPISPKYKYIKTNCSIKETIPFYLIHPFAFDNI